VRASGARGGGAEEEEGDNLVALPACNFSNRSPPQEAYPTAWTGLGGGLYFIYRPPPGRGIKSRPPGSPASVAARSSPEAPGSAGCRTACPETGITRSRTLPTGTACRCVVMGVPASSTGPCHRPPPVVARDVRARRRRQRSLDAWEVGARSSARPPGVARDSRSWRRRRSSWTRPSE